MQKLSFFFHGIIIFLFLVNNNVIAEDKSRSDRIKAYLSSSKSSQWVKIENSLSQLYYQGAKLLETTSLSLPNGKHSIILYLEANLAGNRVLYRCYDNLDGNILAIGQGCFELEK